MSKAAVVNTLVSAIGGAIIGGGITFLVVKKHYREYADNEVAEVRKHYALLRKDDNTVTILGDVPQDFVTETVEEEDTPFARGKKLVEDLGYIRPSTPDEDISEQGDIPTATTRTIFSQAASPDEVGPELDGPNGEPLSQSQPEPEEEELDDDDPLKDYVRMSGHPYIISMEDYYNTEEEWDKTTLSYYEGDDTLVDERDMAIDDVERYIGSRHLDMFGVISNDPKIVYVRNAQISTDFEVIREKGKAAVLVYGQRDDGKPPLRRMRASD